MSTRWRGMACAGIQPRDFHRRHALRPIPVTSNPDKRSSHYRTIWGPGVTSCSADLAPRRRAKNTIGSSLCGWPTAAVSPHDTRAFADLSINELVAAFYRHADLEYPPPSREVEQFAFATKPLLDLFGDTPAKDTEDRVSRLWGLHAAGVEQIALQPAVQELVRSSDPTEDGDRPKRWRATPTRPERRWWHFMKLGNWPQLIRCISAASITW